MRGQVLGVDTRTGDGIVAGEDGRRYSFKPDDWAARGEPAIGMHVDFETHESRALSIFPVPGMPVPRTAPTPAPAERGDRNRYIAAVLAFLVGPHMKGLYDLLPDAMKGAYRATSDEMVQPLLAALKAGDTVLIKGSLGTRMAPLVEAVRALDRNASRPTGNGH